MTLSTWTLTVSISMIPVLLSIIGAMMLGAIRGHHREAMEHLEALGARLEALNESLIGFNAKLDEHIRDHARGVFS